MSLKAGPSGPALYEDDLETGLRVPVVVVRSLPVLLMEAGVDPVSAGTPEPGWVSGNIANLGASVNALVVFDLGVDWRQYRDIALSIYPTPPSTGLNPVQVWGSDSPGALQRRLSAPSVLSHGVIYSNVTTVSGPQQMHVRPTGRYLIVEAKNADAANPQGAASRISLAAYPS